VPVRVACACCNSPCLVAEENLGKRVRCGRCGQTFVPVALQAVAAPPLPASAGPPRLDVGSATSAGRVRTRNEDSFLVQHLVWATLDERHEIALLAVADGMGGHEAGHVASGIVIRSLGSSLAPLLGGALSGKFTGATPENLHATLDFALQEANRAVFRKAQSDPAYKGMGATVALVLVWDGQVLIGHVGDCRVWHLHGGKLNRVTRDQTLVARMVELGTLTPEEAENHPARNEVAQAAGRRFDLQPALHRLPLVPGDGLVVACDGLHAHVNEPALLGALLQPAPSATHRAHRRVEMANAGGGSDNVTVIVVNCF
jgi:serine/threonine protein phosphatase PrpC